MYVYLSVRESKRKSKRDTERCAMAMHTVFTL